MKVLHAVREIVEKTLVFRNRCPNKIVVPIVVFIAAFVRIAYSLVDIYCCMKNVFYTTQCTDESPWLTVWFRGKRVPNTNYSFAFTVVGNLHGQVI